MGIRDIIKKVFFKDKKVVICGLDGAGKTTMVSFLQKGTFINHTPTMGKQTSTIAVNGVQIKLIDMGGQKDFRNLWIGEIKDAQCIIFMLDANAIDRIEEAKAELHKITCFSDSIPLIILANKCDLDYVIPISQIIETLELSKFSSFEIIPISCKTGFGIINAFSKIYTKLTGKSLMKKINPKVLSIFDIGGVPLTIKQGNDIDLDILRGGLLAAISSFAKESFHSELNQIKLEGYLIIIKRTNHLIGSIILDDFDIVNPAEAEICLNELLEHLENMCPELKNSYQNSEKIEFLVEQYSTNFFN